MNKVVITGINTAELPKLSAKESEAMLKEVKLGNSGLRDTFIMSNTRLVLSMVQRFQHSKVSKDDLFQVGMLGLIKALDNFDITLNVRFSTYAVPMIMGEMRRYIRESTALKVGRSVRDIAYKAVLARNKLESERVEEVSLAEIAAEIDVPYVDVCGALDAIAEPVSIYEPVYQDADDSMMILDQIKENKSEYDQVDIMALRNGLEKLPYREKLVVLLRYYKGRTQMEIAESLKMSQAQVSRLEKSAIAKLKSAL